MIKAPACSPMHDHSTCVLPHDFLRASFPMPCRLHCSTFRAPAALRSAPRIRAFPCRIIVPALRFPRHDCLHAFPCMITSMLPHAGYAAAPFERQRLSAALRGCSVPIVALGGITAGNLAEVSGIRILHVYRDGCVLPSAHKCVGM